MLNDRIFNRRRKNAWSNGRLDLPRELEQKAIAGLPGEFVHLVCASASRQHCRRSVAKWCTLVAVRPTPRIFKSYQFFFLRINKKIWILIPKLLYFMNLYPIYRRKQIWKFETRQASQARSTVQRPQCLTKHVSSGVNSIYIIGIIMYIVIYLSSFFV